MNSVPARQTRITITTSQTGTAIVSEETLLAREAAFARFSSQSHVSLLTLQTEHAHLTLISREVHHVAHADDLSLRSLHTGPTWFAVFSRIS